jgi:NADH dehydrogenase
MLLTSGMRILVTGGTGVIGEGVIPELRKRGHQVRLLSRHADDDAKQWEGVEAFPGNVTDPSSLHGAAENCDAIVHIAGIVKENPPDLTFEGVNVGGTQNIINEAKRANVQRFLFISSLGADLGASDYHKSKLDAEQLVERSGLAWTIIRPGNVYGPGDEVISLILKMIRALPAVPVIDSGNQEFQPIWYEDLARVLANVLERDDTRGAILEAAGNDVTSMNDLVDRLGNITDRHPIRVPIPMSLASLTTKLAGMAIEVPVDDAQLTMLQERNVVRGNNALDLVNVQPTPLDEGLRRLADAIPEQLPEDGFGSLQHKKFWADIRGSRYTPASLMSLFRDRVNEIMPIEFSAEPDAPTKAEKGGTMTGALPMRGNFQVRVEVADPTHTVFATVEGHPLAGIVEFRTSEEAGALRFAIDVFARAGNFFDWLATRTVGQPAQAANWRAVVQRMIDASGGTSDGVHQDVETLDDDEAKRVETRVREMVQERKRDETRA